jgi:acyl-CoA thioesterase I
MKFINLIPLIFIFATINLKISAQISDKQIYLEKLKEEFQKEWPKNRTVNLIFHGHSVVVGYFKTPEIKTFKAYPFLTAKMINEIYPISIINIINTAIGGENSEQGARRFKNEVLTHRPDVVFIDYALNDRTLGLKRAKIAWIKMIKYAKKFGAKVILLTPTPDLTENILKEEAVLAMHANQIKKIAELYQVGLIDSYAIFKNIAQIEPLDKYMAQNNHINEKGHLLVAQEILKYFK